MRNIFKLYINDLKRITSNIITMIIIVGLALLPSIFSWYNVLGCWNVFDRTSGITVAVANEDAGYKSDLIPIEMHIGENVISSLRANNQLDWVFTDTEDAIDGTRAGRYYAAVVIPKSFSKDMMTFYSSDMEHAKLAYYTNEKKNVVAPKITDQGADRVSSQINQVFSETMANIGLGIATSLVDYSDNADMEGRLGQLAKHIDSLGNQLDQGADTLESFSSVLSASQTLLDGTTKLLVQAKESGKEIKKEAQISTDGAKEVITASSESVKTLKNALETAAAGYEGVSEAVDAAFEDTNTLAGSTSTALNNQANNLTAAIEGTQALIDALKKADFGPDQEAIDTLIKRLEKSLEMQESLQNTLRTAAQDIESGNASAQETHAEVSKLAADTKANIADLKASFEKDIEPQLKDISSNVSTLAESISASTASLSALSEELSGTTDTITVGMSTAKEKLSTSAEQLRANAAKMHKLSKNLAKALKSKDSEKIKSVLRSDPETFSAALSAPVALNRQAVFPANSFGSQMAPLYTTLGLWVGALLLMVSIKITVSPRQRLRLDDPKPRHLFFGRWLTYSTVSTLQSITMALGNMFFVGVQTVHPLLYLFCFWFSSQVFCFIVYTLVASFANIGKAIAVLMLITQITAGGGAFPLPILPKIIETISPWMPATHVINAMRAAMMGVYQNDFWIEMGFVALYILPCLLLALVLRKPLQNFLHNYEKRVAKSKLMS